MTALIKKKIAKKQFYLCFSLLLFCFLFLFIQVVLNSERRQKIDHIWKVLHLNNIPKCYWNIDTTREEKRVSLY